MIRRGALLFLLLAACGGGERVIVGAGTTTVDSGFMAELERAYGEEVSIVPGSTAELLELAAQGAVDVVIVHDEAQEMAFMADHSEAVRAEAFTSSFLLVGPADQVDRLAVNSAAETLEAISANQLTFVTRADGSGTHSREQALWRQAGVDPTGDWYVATGQGMGLTLQVADQRDGFTLVELGVFESVVGTIDLVPVAVPNDGSLDNPYSLILVSAAGSGFFNWLVSDEGAAGVAAANDAVFGSDVYRR